MRVTESCDAENISLVDQVFRFNRHCATLPYINQSLAPCMVLEWGGLRGTTSELTTDHGRLGSS
jgi:hypothetical protein